MPQPEPVDPVPPPEPTPPGTRRVRINDTALPDLARGRPKRPEPQVIVTVGLDTLLGRDHNPAELAGYGPIPAAIARDLATRGVWRCAATDDHGTILGLGRATFTPNYRPPAATARLVRLRDTECVFPGCRRQARYCDLDHRVPHRLGGATCDCNLQVLCGHHHRLKHEAGFEVTLDADAPHHDPDGLRPPSHAAAPAGTGSGDSTDPGAPRRASAPPGTLTWTTPTGRRVLRHPTPVVTAQADGRTGPIRRHHPTSPPAAPDEPPF
jgi:hypothetical protein